MGAGVGWRSIDCDVYCVCCCCPCCCCVKYTHRWRWRRLRLLYFFALLCSCLFLVCCFALSILYTFVVLSRNFRSLCRSLARARTHTHTDTPTLWMSVYASIDINLFLCFVALCTRFLSYLILARYFCLRIVHMCKMRIYIYFWIFRVYIVYRSRSICALDLCSSVSVCLGCVGMTSSSSFPIYLIFCMDIIMIFPILLWYFRLA